MLYNNNNNSVLHFAILFLSCQSIEDRFDFVVRPVQKTHSKLTQKIYLQIEWWISNITNLYELILLIMNSNILEDFWIHCRACSYIFIIYVFWNSVWYNQVEFIALNVRWSFGSHLGCACVADDDTGWQVIELHSIGLVIL